MLALEDGLYILLSSNNVITKGLACGEERNM